MKIVLLVLVYTLAGLLVILWLQWRKKIISTIWSIVFLVAGYCALSLILEDDSEPGEEEEQKE